MKRLMMAIASVLVSALAFYGFTAPASAQELGSAPPSSTQESGQSGREDPDLAGKVSAARSSVSPGESVFVDTVNGYDLYQKEDAEGGFRIVAADAGAEGDADAAGGACTSLVAAGVYALGAGALAAAAASGGLEIAGVFLAPEMLYMLSGVAISWSAVQGIVAAYVC